MSQKDAQNEYKDGPFRGPGLDDIAAKIDEILFNAIKKVEAQLEVIETESSNDSESAKKAAALMIEVNGYRKDRNDIIDKLKETFKIQKSIDEANAEIASLEVQNENYSCLIEQFKEQIAVLDKQIEEFTAESKKKHATLSKIKVELDSTEKKAVVNEQTQSIFQAVCDFRMKEDETRKKIIKSLAKKNPMIPIDVDNADLLAVIRLIDAAKKSGY